MLVSMVHARPNARQTSVSMSYELYKTLRQSTFQRVKTTPRWKQKENISLGLEQIAQLTHIAQTTTFSASSSPGDVFTLTQSNLSPLLDCAVSSMFTRASLDGTLPEIVVSTH